MTLISRGDSHIVFTANGFKHISVRRLNERKRKRSRRIGLKVLNDPTTPRLNLVRRLLISLSETALRNKTIVSERLIKSSRCISRDSRTNRGRRNATTHISIGLTNENILC
ncbi:Hypothetical protein ROUS_13 [Brevibacterium phage Rousseau]|nr:Hypothetical protein ROUS_13 [Brevibacterium phage Rousseau]